MEWTAWRQRARQQATEAGIDPDEVDWLLREAAGLDALALQLGTPAPKAISLAEIEALWRRRRRDRVPLQYLVGRAPWREFELAVSPAVLIPRPETELLVELAFASGPACGVWADVGTGSGAIAIALAAGLPEASVIATDASAAALEVARQNAEGAGVAVEFRRGSWFAPLADLRDRLGGMVSNPPYIPSAEVDCLQPEVARYEPRSALDGGPDGLACVRHLVAAAPDYLRSGGFWGCEVMAGQAEAAIALLEQQGSYMDVRAVPDLAGIERFCVARRV